MAKKKNSNSQISRMLTVGYSPTKEVTAGMLKTPLMIVKINKSQTIYVIDIMGKVVKWAYMTKKGIGMIRTTQSFEKSKKRWIEIKGKKINI